MKEQLRRAESSPGLLGRLDPVCDRFEEAWRAGERPRLEDFLPLVEERDRPALMRELLAMEREYRLRRGEQPTEEEYRLRLPEYAAVVQDAFSRPAAPPRKDDWRDLLAPARDPGELGWLGPYRVLRVLGQGGMGVVFEAEDPRLKRRVALKAVLPALAGSELARKRFLREAETVAALEHDNVVSIYQADEDRGVPYLAMPLLKGETLAARLEREPGPLPLAETLRIGRETALGLAAAHQRGLVHRDVKPGNLWLEAGGGRVKVLDFGLALSADNPHLTQTGVIAGTPAFMAPEQVNGLEVDSRSDLFSLGCVLYRMAAGRPPFTGATAVAVLWSICHEDCTPPAQHNPAVPATLAVLIQQLLARNPKDRPSSATAVAQALAAVEADPTHGQPDGQEAELSQTVIQPAPARPRWWFAAAAAALLAASAAALTAVGLRGRDGKEAPRASVSLDGRGGGGEAAVEKPPGKVMIEAPREDRVRQAQELHARMLQLHAEGKSGQALSVAREALALREQLYPGKDHPELAQSHFNLGILLLKSGEATKALPHYQETLAINRKMYPAALFPNGCQSLVNSLRSLAKVHFALGDPAKALPLYEEALAIRQRLAVANAVPDADPGVAESLAEVGSLLYAMGNKPQALPYIEKAAAMSRALYREDSPDLAVSLNNLGVALNGLARAAQALPHLEKALAIREKLWTNNASPETSAELARSHHNLAAALLNLGRSAEAVAHYRQTLAINQKIYPETDFPNGHVALVNSLKALGDALLTAGETARALPCFEKALAVNQKLYPESRFPEGHSAILRSLNDLAGVLRVLGQPAKALPRLEESAAMHQRLYPTRRFPQGRFELAESLAHLGNVLQVLGKPAQALPYQEKALAMYQKLFPESRFPEGHPTVAWDLVHVSRSQCALGEAAKALPSSEKALAMSQRIFTRRLFPEGHPALARTLHNLGAVHDALGAPAKALPYHEQALEVRAKQANRETAALEAQALASLRPMAASRDVCLSTALHLPRTEASSYDWVWAGKSAGLRVLLHRQETAAAARLKSGEAREQWQQYIDVRRRINRLLLNPGNDLAARDRLRDRLAEEQKRLERAVALALPEFAADEELARLAPGDLAAQLPARTAFVDFVRFAYSNKGKFSTWRYLAFVVAPGQPVRRVDLGDASAIDGAVVSWRGAIARDEAGPAPARLRELVWQKIEEALPSGATTLYLCPDGELARLPFAALPGRKKDAVLLEEYRLAIVPGGAWLLQQVRRPGGKAYEGRTLLAVGGLDYGKTPDGVGGYGPLPETARELQRVMEAFPTASAVSLTEKKATAQAVRERLADVDVAHLATHDSFDEKAAGEDAPRAKEQRERWNSQGEGPRGANPGVRNPLGFVGLVLAGGNDPARAEGGGVLTGLDVLELPLGKLRLCVLSACRTAQGEWIEGATGLSLAFHAAGCPNVVGSLWQVNDPATSALTTQFYHELKVNQRCPLDALREAQLTIYRNPERIAALAGQNGRPALEKAVRLGSTQAKAPAGASKTGAKRWAGFVLSGAGR